MYLEFKYSPILISVFNTSLEELHFQLSLHIKLKKKTFRFIGSKAMEVPSHHNAFPLLLFCSVKLREKKICSAAHTHLYLSRHQSLIPAGSSASKVLATSY